MRRSLLWGILLGWNLFLALDSGFSQMPVGRQTIDREQDLFDALLSANRFDDAMQLCQMEGRDADQRSDSAAKWAVRKSRVLSAMQMTREQFTDSDVQLAQAPVAELLDAYPDHRRKLMLQAQLSAVERDAARHSVLVAAISPGDSQLKDAAAARLVSAASGLESLAKQIIGEQSRLSANRDANIQQEIADLVRLEQELQVDAVSLALAQTELFPRGSQDSIAAAVSAEQSAVKALSRLPNGSFARTEVERLRIDAILRSDQAQRADQAWKEVFESQSAALTSRAVALRIRVDLALDRLSQAESSLTGYYGSDPNAAPRSIEMDLARLEYLMRSEQITEIGRWLDQMGDRGGPYSRRRAEAWSLSFMKRGSGSSQPSMDPSLIAAQAKDWLRRGEVARAAELLSAAAASESDASRAIARAIEAAAVWKKAGSLTKAAEILSDIALTHPDGGAAAGAHLQATVLVASGTESTVVQTVEAMLKRNLKQWPRGEMAEAARRWLIQILDSQARQIEAAVVATQIDSADIDATRIDRMRQCWQVAFQSTDDDQISKVDAELRSAFEPMREHPTMLAAYRWLLVTIADRASLQGLPPSESSEPAWVDALGQYRLTGSVVEDLQAVPSEVRDDVIRRLMLDGRAEPARRTSIASLLASWNESEAPSLGRIERLLWLNQTPLAIQTAKDLVDQSPESAETLRQVAELLGSSSQREAREQAIQWWDQLAAGAPTGGALWHEAKLSAIKLLAAIGQADQSRRRAEYILLTNPKLDADLRRRYQTAANQP
jgi:hypothetical protein